MPGGQERDWASAASDRIIGFVYLGSLAAR